MSINSQKVVGIIIAAGNSTRMQSNRYKQEYMFGSKILVQHAVEALKSAGVADVVVVLNKNLQRIEEYLTQQEGVHVAYQVSMKGTAGAVATGIEFWTNHNSTNGQKRELGNTPILITCGDMPLIHSSTYAKMVELYTTGEGVDVVLATANLDNPYGYGRIVRTTENKVDKIVEHKDASAKELKISEVNTGVYMSNIQTLNQLISKVGTANSSQEYYLTDIVTSESKAVVFDDPNQFTGINTRTDLSHALEIYFERNANRLMENSGVTVMNPKNTYIDHDVTAGKDTIIYPNVTLQGATSLGEGVIVHSGSRLADSVVGDGVNILDGSIVLNSTVENLATVGPYAYLRPGTTLGEASKAGTFVEMKKATIGNNAKVPHLSYIGDATVGDNTNVGCGTITVNYDGFNKNRTNIGSNAFVGSGAMLIAPVEVADGAMVAAGTVVTQGVPTDALGIARSPQRNVDGFVEKYRKGKKKIKQANSSDNTQKQHS